MEDLNAFPGLASLFQLIPDVDNSSFMEPLTVRDKDPSVQSEVSGAGLVELESRLRREHEQVHHDPVLL